MKLFGLVAPGAPHIHNVVEFGGEHVVLTALTALPPRACLESRALLCVNTAAAAVFGAHIPPTARVASIDPERPPVCDGGEFRPRGWAPLLNLAQLDEPPLSVIETGKCTIYFVPQTQLRQCARALAPLVRALESLRGRARRARRTSAFEGDALSMLLKQRLQTPGEEPALLLTLADPAAEPAMAASLFALMRAFALLAFSRSGPDTMLAAARGRVRQISERAFEQIAAQNSALPLQLAPEAEQTLQYKIDVLRCRLGAHSDDASDNASDDASDNASDDASDNGSIVENFERVEDYSSGTGTANETIDREDSDGFIVVEACATGNNNNNNGDCGGTIRPHSGPEATSCAKLQRTE